MDEISSHGRVCKWIAALLSLVFLVLINAAFNFDLRLTAVVRPQAVDSNNSGEERAKHPKVVWLMSFPNSGTTYTLKYIQGATETTTATNYGSNEQVGFDNSIPVHPEIPSGPFFRYPNRSHPERYILTKTHCESNSLAPPYNASQFAGACCTGNRNVNNVSHVTTYPQSQVVAAVHLIRNPFDNIVARMHYKQTEWSKSQDPKDQELAELMSLSPQGLSLWCLYLNFTEFKQTRRSFSASFWDTYMEPIPCAMEFYRYFRWHDLAVTTSSALPRPTMILYYENYTSTYDATTQELLNFLQLQRSETGVPPQFVLGKTYTDWFTMEVHQNVQRLASVLLSNATWMLLQHYFDVV
jgi:Sulfotransferase domain